MTPVAFCLMLYGFCFFFVAGDKRSMIAALAIGRNITQRKWMLALLVTTDLLFAPFTIVMMLVRKSWLNNDTAELWRRAGIFSEILDENDQNFSRSVVICRSCSSPVEVSVPLRFQDYRLIQPGVDPFELRVNCLREAVGLLKAGGVSNDVIHDKLDEKLQAIEPRLFLDDEVALGMAALSLGQLAQTLNVTLDGASERARRSLVELHQEKPELFEPSSGAEGKK